MVHKPHFVLGVIAEFVFIGLQVAIMALFSAFAMKHWTAFNATQQRLVHALKGSQISLDSDKSTD